MAGHVPLVFGINRLAGSASLAGFAVDFCLCAGVAYLLGGNDKQTAFFIILGIFLGLRLYVFVRRTLVSRFTDHFTTEADRYADETLQKLPLAREADWREWLTQMAFHGVKADDARRAAEILAARETLRETYNDRANLFDQLLEKAYRKRLANENNHKT